MISIVIDISFILLILFFVTKRKMHIFQYIYIWFLLTFIFITVIDVLSPHNSNMLQMTNKPSLYYGLLLGQTIIVPIIIFYYLEWMSQNKGIQAKVLLTVAFTIVLVITEKLFIYLDIFKYEKWKPWWSYFVWPIFLLFFYGLNMIYRNTLHKEGIIR